jgi:hypothetical protein
VSKELPLDIIEQVAIAKLRWSSLGPSLSVSSSFCFVFLLLRLSSASSFFCFVFLLLRLSSASSFFCFVFLLPQRSRLGLESCAWSFPLDGRGSLSDRIIGRDAWE